MIESNRFKGIEISLIRQVINLAPPGAINMALGELGYPLPAPLREQAHVLLDCGTAVYTPNAGLPELRELIAQQYLDASTPDQICVCNGAEEAVFLTMLAITNPGDTIAIVDPDYTAYPAIAQILGCNVLSLPYAPDLISIDWEHWDRLLGEAKATVLLLSKPQNPSGKYFNHDELNSLSTICNRHRIALVVDEIYRDLYFAEPIPRPGDRFEQLIRIGGVSKSHCMSGWRLGWVNAPSQISPSIIKAKQYVSTCAHWLSQKLAVQALSPRGMAANEDIRNRLKQDREYALDELKQLLAPCSVHAPQAGPYIMIKTPWDDLELAASLAKQGLIVVPGSAFGLLGKNWLRLNFAVHDQQLRRGLQILIESLNNMESR